MAAMWQGFLAFWKDYVFDTIKDIRIIDVLDILFLALIFYFLYRFVRDRRAAKLLFGLLFVIVLFIISSEFHMYALNFVFQNFYQVGMIAIIVMFQPELRAALEKVGSSPLMGLKSITSDSRALAAVSENIDGLCRAASDLSRDKVGALIVIERTTELGDYAKSGVTVDALITPHMLRNIFFNNAPLHDGAVIIRDGRILAAGCFLPLSTQEDISKELGTRHRAAIGLSEVSDALVIVVSEETGTISLAENSTLERNFNYNTLKQALNSRLIPQGQSENGGKKSKKH